MEVQNEFMSALTEPHFDTMFESWETVRCTLRKVWGHGTTMCPEQSPRRREAFWREGKAVL
jgi:hypothetical protein